MYHKHQTYLENLKVLVIFLFSLLTKEVFMRMFVAFLNVRLFHCITYTLTNHSLYKLELLAQVVG